MDPQRHGGPGDTRASGSALSLHQRSDRQAAGNSERGLLPLALFRFTVTCRCVLTGLHSHSIPVPPFQQTVTMREGHRAKQNALVVTLKLASTAVLYSKECSFLSHSPAAPWTAEG